MWVVYNARINRIVFPKILQGKECAVIDTTPFEDEQEANEFKDECNDTDQENGNVPSFEVVRFGD